MRYDPSKPIDAETWLSIDEGERLYAVQSWIADLIGSEVEDCMVAAVSVLAVENQVAMGDPPVTRATLERLLADGIDRMSAIQVMSDIFADSLAEALAQNREHDEGVYAQALERIDPAEIVLDHSGNGDAPAAVPEFSAEHRQVLIDFGLRHAEQQAMSWPETAGFLFAVLTCPDFVPPSEWIEVVQGEAVFADLEEARAVSEARMALMNWVSERIRQNQLVIPEDCRPGPDPLRMLEEDNDFSRWCRGLTSGHFLLGEAWEEVVEEDSDVDRSLGIALVIFSFFGDRKMAESLLEDMDEDNPPQTMTLEEAASKFHPLLEDAALAYAAIGLEYRRMPAAPAPRQPVRSEKIGRNQPCPCGSGKKYKKCCGQPKARPRI